MNISGFIDGTEFEVDFEYGVIGGFADSPYGSMYGGMFELSKEQTKKLYLAMKEYYEVDAK